MLLTEAQRVVQRALDASQLCVVVGNCRVQYKGRAASKLSEGDRLLIVKHDGTFLVHQSMGMTAINYQGPGARISTGLDDGALTVTATRKRKEGAEEIAVRFARVDFAQAFPLQDDSKLKVFGTERELADLLMEDLSVLEKGLVPLQKESDVRKGTIDILARDAKGHLVVIEVKRRKAELAAVTQLKRYVEDLSKRKGERVRGFLVAPSVTENAGKMLEDWGLEFAKLDYEIHNPRAEIKGLQKKQKMLGEYVDKPKQ